MVSRLAVVALAAIAVAGASALVLATQGQFAGIALYTTHEAPMDVSNCPLAAILPESLAAGNGTDAGLPANAGASAIPPEIAAAGNCFAVNFYRQISGGDGNVFFSPISVYAAFSMVGEGANGQTASQLRDAFGFERDPELRHSQITGLVSSLNRPDPHATLIMANSLWLAEWFEPYDSYVVAIRHKYQADTDAVDFLGDGVDRINDWAAEKTQGKIPKVLDRGAVNSETAAALLNAIYFKGTWAYPFPVESTHESDFWTGEREVRADFMSMTRTFDYTQSDGVQVLRMPYQGDRLSMLVLLPSDRNGLGSLEGTVTPERISQWEDGLATTLVRALIPKFEMRTHYDLKQPLEDLGVTDVFDKHASDLSGMARLDPGDGLYVSRATQDAYVKVNEKGTEAAAVTAVTATQRIMISPPPEPVPFIADHPFLFLIQDDDSGTILFMGRVSDPS